MNSKDAQHIKDLLESSELSNRRLAIMMLAEMDDFEPLLKAFEQEDKILLIQRPKALKKYITTTDFKQDENWEVWEDSGRNYTFETKHPFFVVYKAKKRLILKGIQNWEGKWEELRELVTLKLVANGLQAIPKPINTFRKLETLEITDNEFPLFPKEILNLPRLKVLGFSGNGTKTLIKNMTHDDCMFLDLSRNALTSFPGESKVKFLRLTTLNLHQNNLHKLGKAIGTLDSLKRLDLSMNPLRDLPLELFDLQNLNVLGLAGTQLTTLAPEIGACKKLFMLKLNGTAVKRLPDTIAGLNLKLLNISQTPMAADKDYIQYLKKLLPKTNIKHKI